MRIVVASALLSLLGAAAFAQDAAQSAAKSPYMSVIGTVESVDTSGKVVTVKPDKGDNTTVKFDDKTAVMRVAAGETDMKKAVAATAADIAAGDRIIARVFTADPTGKPARTFYVTKQAEVAQRLQASAEEWKNATTGLVTAIDSGSHQIKMNSKVPGSQAPKEIAVDISGKIDYRHYNPDSGAYEASTLTAIAVGDQLRVLGEKNADSTEIKAQRIGSGSFKTIGVQVKSIDPATRTILGTETASKKPVTIVLRTDTSLKKFNDMAAMMVARQLNPSYQGMGGGRGGRGGGGAPGAGGEAPASAGRDAQAGPGGRGPGGGGRGGRGMDMNRIIEQQPSIELADLRPGDAVIVTGATGNDPAKITATALIAGVEQILRAAPASGADPLAGSWNMDVGGGGGGQ